MQDLTKLFNQTRKQLFIIDEVLGYLWASIPKDNPLYLLIESSIESVRGHHKKILDLFLKEPPRRVVCAACNGTEQAQCYTRCPNVIQSAIWPYIRCDVDYRMEHGCPPCQVCGKE